MGCVGTKSPKLQEYKKTTLNLIDEPETPFSKNQRTNPLVIQPYNEYKKQIIRITYQNRLGSYQQNTNKDHQNHIRHMNSVPARLVSSPEKQYKKYMQQLEKQKEGAIRNKDQNIQKPQKLNLQKGHSHCSSDLGSRSTNSNQNSKLIVKQVPMIDQSVININIPIDNCSLLKKAQPLPTYDQSKININI